MSKAKPLPNRLSVILLRGGGDLASGVALRLHRIGVKVVISELAQPLAVRRKVSFSEAISSQAISVEGVLGRKVPNATAALEELSCGNIPILVDPDGTLIQEAEFDVQAVVDARMLKRPPDQYAPAGKLWAAPFVIGLGPGFVAGKNCHAVIETNRGHNLGRVLWVGAAEPNTGVPGKVGKYRQSRVIRAPQAGTLSTFVEIGARVKMGEQLASIAGELILAPFDGILRGMLPTGFSVSPGLKIGDLDPRDDSHLAVTVSDKSLAIGGGVIEALLSHPDIRAKIWN